MESSGPAHPAVALKCLGDQPWLRNGPDLVRSGREDKGWVSGAAGSSCPLAFRQASIPGRKTD